MIKMEEKLKTLKDLRKILVWPERKALSLFELKQTNAIIEKDIRQEAIKWIKKDTWMMFFRSFTEGEWAKKCEEWGQTPPVIAEEYKNWIIKKIFNITNEDLK